ncbi:hypothetical protein BT63DRAFT_418151 [Microthyrium microscopicum]|uniref:Uncharacterized protein n=1 Tax=Microthyrium microscopicum TaxID=703497 RepID=A0A6A6U066_9PEZI|nr:hypothetical protein BT63DRAFT_418151 [Microthyrium microscopicum]
MSTTLLRANRQDSTLPDSHGQVWIELVALVDADKTLFQGTNGPLQDEMLQMLGLSGRVQFPIRRLVTLWKNNRWQRMTTRWCQTSLGRATFNVSLREEMARCRIDDLVGDDLKAIQLADWNLLVQLPLERSATDFQRTFYPDAPVDVLINSSSSRRPNFLPKLDHAAYHRVYEIIVSSTHLCFPDIQRILRVGRAQGKTVSSLMNHVVQWLNPVPNSGDKLQLWQGLLPESLENNDREARILQSEIFNVMQRILTWTGSQLPIWRDILIAVHKAIGPRFHGVLGQFNTQDPAGLPSQRQSTFIQAFCDAISHIPHVARNPALRSSLALKALIHEISPAITAWVVQHCDTALREQILGRTPSCPPSVRELVKCQLGELEGTVSSFSHVKEPTSLSAVPIIRPESRQSERYDVEGAVEDIVFPQILGSFACVFGLATNEMLVRFRAQGSTGLGIALAEGVAALDRLGHYCFTGSPLVLMSSVLKPLQTMDSLQRGGWPFIDPGILDLRQGEGTLDIANWPRAKDGRPIFMHVASLAFHYGPEIAESRHSLVWFRDLGGKSISGPASATRFLEDLFRDLWIPQMVEFISHQLRRHASRDQDLSLQLLQEQRTLIETWSHSPHPFTWSNYKPIWSLTNPVSTVVSETTKSRQDFAHKLYQKCMQNDGPGRHALSSLHSTCSKRAAIEVESRAGRAIKRQAIDFGYEIPFTCIPSIVEDGFRAQEKIFAKGNQKILEHYHVARNCLERSLGDPLCDVLLMLVLTFSSSSVTPRVAAQSKHFKAGPRKDPRIFAASMVTRMLWFLHPEAFPSEQDDGMVLRVPEMTKKIEHKGVNNRLLREMGWVEDHGKRENPRNSDLSLRAVDELLKIRTELLSLRRDPAGFVAQVFRSHDSVWLERCSMILWDQSPGATRVRSKYTVTTPDEVLKVVGVKGSSSYRGFTTGKREQGFVVDSEEDSDEDSNEDSSNMSGFIVPDDVGVDLESEGDEEIPDARHASMNDKSRKPSTIDGCPYERHEG